MCYVSLQFKSPTAEWLTLAHPLGSAIVTSTSRLWLAVKVMRCMPIFKLNMYEVLVYHCNGYDGQCVSCRHQRMVCNLRAASAHAARCVHMHKTHVLGEPFKNIFEVSVIPQNSLHTLACMSEVVRAHRVYTNMRRLPPRAPMWTPTLTSRTIFPVFYFIFGAHIELTFRVSAPLDAWLSRKGALRRQLDIHAIFRPLQTLVTASDQRRLQH